MEFKVKHGIFGSVKYLIINEGNTCIVSDMLDKEEANALAKAMRDCADDLAFDEE